MEKKSEKKEKKKHHHHHHHDKDKEKQNESEEINLEDKDLYDVRCVYTIDGNKEIKFIDENILVYAFF